MFLSKYYIEINTKDNTLNLPNRDNSDDDVALICDYLRNNPQIIILNVSASRISSQSFKDIVAITSLQSLDVSWNNLDDESIRALEGTTHLSTLIAEHNKITDEGAMILSSITSLTTLKLKQNSITNKGAKALADNKNLIEVDLMWNRLVKEEFVPNSNGTPASGVDLSLIILKGFIAAVGITIVAVALILNAPTVALATAAVCVGTEGILQIASVLKGYGLFAANKESNSSTNDFMPTCILKSTSAVV